MIHKFVNLALPLNFCHSVFAKMIRFVNFIEVYISSFITSYEANNILPDGLRFLEHYLLLKQLPFFRLGFRAYILHFWIKIDIIRIKIRSILLRAPDNLKRFLIYIVVLSLHFYPKFFICAVRLKICLNVKITYRQVFSWQFV